VGEKEERRRVAERLRCEVERMMSLFAHRVPSPSLLVDEGNDYDELPPVASSKTSPLR